MSVLRLTSRRELGPRVAPDVGALEHEVGLSQKPGDPQEPGLVKKRTTSAFRSPSKRRSAVRVTVRATALTASPGLEVSSFLWSIRPLIWSR